MYNINLDALSVLFFVAGVYICHAADFFAAAWHEEKPVFHKGTFTNFIKQTFAGQNTLSVLLIGRKRNTWLVESLAGGSLMVSFYGVFGLTSTFALMTFLLFAFAVGLISDLKWREIPHEINHLIAIVAVVNAIMGGFPSILCSLVGIIPTVLLLISTFVLYLIRPERGFGVGGGDLRFLFSTGMLLGISFSTVLLLLGCLFTVLFNIVCLVKDFRFGTTTYAPMMVGFSMAYLVMLFGHYLVVPAYDMIPILTMFVP